MLAVLNGKPVTAETTFRPDTTEGTLDIPFTFDAAGLGSHVVVVFEKLFVTAKDDKGEKDVEVASHEDITVEGQTVKLIKIPEKPEMPTVETPEIPQTGEDTNLWVPIVVLLAALVGIAVVVIWIYRKRI